MFPHAGRLALKHIFSGFLAVGMMVSGAAQAADFAKTQKQAEARIAALINQCLKSATERHGRRLYARKAQGKCQTYFSSGPAL